MGAEECVVWVSEGGRFRLKRAGRVGRKMNGASTSGMSLSPVALRRLGKELEEWQSGSPVPGMTVAVADRLDEYVLTRRGKVSV